MQDRDETWFLTLRESHSLREFWDRLLRKVLRPKGDEVTGGWRKLNNGEFNNFYFSPDIFRLMKSMRVNLTVNVVRTREVLNED
jgi:hypothetical protein